MLWEFCLGYGFFWGGGFLLPHDIFQDSSSATCLAFLSLLSILVAEIQFTAAAEELIRFTMTASPLW